MKNLDYKKIALWTVIFLVIYAMALERPVHQDDGWYASLALRYMDQLGALDNASFFSIADNYGGRDSPFGVIFVGILAVFYLIFDFSIETTRLSNAVSIFGIVVIFHLLAREIISRFKWWLTTVLLIHPVFYYHFYNRPEIVAALLFLASIYLLLYKANSRAAVFFAFFSWAFILDAHPIAIFSVIGIGVWFWFKNINRTWLIIFSGLAGLAFKMMVNQAINGNVGLFSGFFGQAPVDFGDHYLPILKSDLADFINITLSRFDTIKSFIVYSGIFVMIPLILMGRQRGDFLRHPITINYFVFLILSSAGTEASSNGFGLYSIINLFLLYAVSIQHLPKLQNHKYGWLIFIVLVVTSLRSTGTTLIQYVKYNKEFNVTYSKFTSCFKPNTKYLMRPTFVFENHNKNIWSDASFGILNVMRDRKIGFMDAIIFKKYDYIVLDEKHLTEEFLTDVRPKDAFINPAFISYQNIGLKKQEWDDLLSSGKLQAVCEFNEISHGHTVLYKVNKSP